MNSGLGSNPSRHVPRWTEKAVLQREGDRDRETKGRQREGETETERERKTGEGGIKTEEGQPSPECRD